MRVAAALILVLVAGCGGGAPTPSTGTTAPMASTPPAPPTTPAVQPKASTTPTSSAPPPTTPATAPAATPGTDCDKLGISRAGKQEGPCTHGAIAVYVANRGTTVPLTELNVRLEGIGLQPAEGDDVYANVVLTVKNNTDRPAAFDADGGQTILTLGRHRFIEDLDVESAPGIAKPWRGVPIDPGASLPARIVYTIPKRLAKRFATVGYVAVTQFSDSGRRTPRHRVAILRTYR